MIYMLKFSQPIGNPDHRNGQAQYYLGYCADNRLAQRIREHKNGTGAAITRALRAAGITFELVLVLRTGTRRDERRLKSWKSHERVLAHYARKKYYKRSLNYYRKKLIAEGVL